LRAWEDRNRLQQYVDEDEKTGMVGETMEEVLEGLSKEEKERVMNGG